MATTNLGTVAIHGEGEWSAENAYTKLSVVAYNGGSYMAVQNVPAGTALTDSSYWLPIADTKETLREWLDEHPEATTTVEDGSVSAQKLTPELAAEVNRIGVVDERVDEVEDEVYSQQTDMAVLNSRMAAIESGTTPEGSEVIGIRTGVDGTAYATAGDAVREQVRRIVSATPWELSLSRNNKTHNGVTYTWNGDVCAVSGTATALSFCNLISSPSALPIGVRPGERIYLRISTSSDDIWIRVYVNHGGESTSYHLTEDTIIAIPQDGNGMTVRIEVSAGKTVDGTIRCEVYSGVPLAKMLDQTLSVAGQAADAAATGSAINGAVAYATEIGSAATEFAVDLRPLEMCAYTRFDHLQKWWDLTGGLVNDNLYHSQLLRINPETDYYVSYSNTTSAVRGAFFDAKGNWIAPLRNWRSDDNPGDMVPVDYTTPTYNRVKSNYASLYKITSPPDAYYVSLNLFVESGLSGVGSRYYREYICSKPAILYTGGDNIEVYRGDAAYERCSRRKMLVIGPSTVMIDRLFRSNANDQHIIGFQEYLIPWFDTVDSVGVSGGSWAPVDPDGVSIWDGLQVCISQHGLDLSLYDDFIITSSINNIASTEIGHYNDAASITSPTNTYFGGINALILAIYQANPVAKIYIATMLHSPSYFETPAYRDRVDTINQEVRKLSEYKSIELIDLCSGTGFNDVTYPEFTYDGTHFNHKGSKVIGEYIRRQIVGV